ncbi:MAG: inosine monophosphate cyclohydrolase [Ruminococcaceae bacterium]|nr:inosine monophosphate cyclohydrolase [Oscillospiraceae bacterium]
MNKLNLTRLLESNAYPGRGIVLGRSADNKYAVAAYFIMGRSENSRNRVFTVTEDGIRTEAFDPSKMVDPSLIIYHPVRQVGDKLVVTNGDQTDTVRDFLVAGKTTVEALHTREFEPDGPNYTPRISGVMEKDGSFQLSILKSADGDPVCSHRFFYDYSNPLPGEGRFIHTYMGDGNPLPSFEGEPERVVLDASSAEALAEQMWNALNADNKVSLFVRYIDLETGEKQEVIKNKFE